MTFQYYIPGRSIRLQSANIPRNYTVARMVSVAFHPTNAGIRDSLVEHLLPEPEIRGSRVPRRVL